MIPALGRRRCKSWPRADSELDDMQFTRDGKTMVYTQQSGVSPVEIYRASSSGGATGSALTHLNDSMLNDHQLTPLEEFWVDAPTDRAFTAS
jgi:dipeptidyl aminopeptidase/acylaminoacyl peptidase